MGKDSGCRGWRWRDLFGNKRFLFNSYVTRDSLYSLYKVYLPAQLLSLESGNNTAHRLFQARSSWRPCQSRLLIIPCDIRPIGPRPIFSQWSLLSRGILWRGTIHRSRVSGHIYSDSMNRTISSKHLREHFVLTNTGLQRRRCYASLHSLIGYIHPQLQFCILYRSGSKPKDPAADRASELP